MVRPWERSRRPEHRGRHRTEGAGHPDTGADVDPGSNVGPDDARPGPDLGSDSDVPLDGPEHAWWSTRELDATWAPRPPEPEPDPLEVHFGPDWGRAYGFDDLLGPSTGTVPDEAPVANHGAPAADDRPDGTGDRPNNPDQADSRPDEPDTTNTADRPDRTGDRPDSADRADSHGWPDSAVGPGGSRLPDAYVVLGVAPDAAWEDIVAAHRAAVRTYHPDRFAGDGSDADRARAEEAIIRINAAYRELRIRRDR